MSIQRIPFRVEELDCAEEVRQLRDALEQTPGIHELGFDVIHRRLLVTLDAAVTAPEEVQRVIRGLGMHAAVEGHADAKIKPERRRADIRTHLTVGAALLIAMGFVLHGVLTGEWLGALAIDSVNPQEPTPWVARICYAAAMACGLWFVAPRAWLSVRQFRADMNLLMCIAVVGAVALGQWLEAATVTFLFQVALMLEHWSMGRARRAIRTLLELSPPTARCWEADTGHWHERPVEQVRVGDRIAVHPGERISLDGTVRTGQSSVNQAPITGESLPVAKSPGDEVFAGTINGEGTLEIDVTRPATESTLAHIIHQVQEAHARRAPSEQWVERFARYYTPVMMALAVCIALVPPLLFAAPWTTWIYNSLVLLVIACPCALVISTPVSIVSALTAAVNNGVLIKGGKFLESAADLRAIAMDKTGTLTRGRPVVQEIVPLNNHSRFELLQRAVALESQSTHPIAVAIRERARAESIETLAVAEFRTLAGLGAEATVAGKRYWIGSERLMLERMPQATAARAHSERLEDAGHSVVAIGNAEHVCGLISVADEVRQEAIVAVRALRELGVQHIRMLTGDNRETARAIASVVGVDDYMAESLPQDKVRELQALLHQYGSVAMIGDGVNDAPAMATATLGIAMGAIGADAAIEAADIALMSDDLTKVPWLMRLARRTVRTIKQNIAFALGLKLLFIGLAAGGIASLWLAILADTGASLLVVFNGLRLLRPRL